MQDHSKCSHEENDSGRASDLRRFPVHVGLGAQLVAQPAFTGVAWYEGYVARTTADGREGRLLSMHDFSQSWDSWEMHPAGDELVLCIAGEITLLQEQADGSVDKLTLRPGEYAINPPGVWHTADTKGPASALFLTAGLGTEHRPR